MNLQKTLLTFLYGCMPARLLIAFIAFLLNKPLLRIMGYLAFIPVIGFLYLFFTGTRNKTGAFGEKIWWISLRPVHALLYFLFAYNAIKGNRGAYVYLLADALLGLVGFLYVHSSNGDFSKAFL
jgi:hypothetical protein